MQELVLKYRRRRRFSTLGVTLALLIVGWSSVRLIEEPSIFYLGITVLAAATLKYFIDCLMRSFHQIILDPTHMTWDKPTGRIKYPFSSLTKIIHTQTRFSIPYIEIHGPGKPIQIHKDIRDYAPLYFFLRSNIGIREDQIRNIDQVKVANLKLIYNYKKGRTTFEIKAKDHLAREVNLEERFPVIAKEALFFHLITANPDATHEIQKEKVWYAKPPGLHSTIYFAYSGVLCLLVAVVMQDIIQTKRSNKSVKQYEKKVQYETSLLENFSPARFDSFIDTSKSPLLTHPDYEVYKHYELATKFINHWQSKPNLLKQAIQALLKAERVNRDYPPIYVAYARIAIAKSYKAGTVHDREGLKVAQRKLNHAAALDPNYLVIHTEQAQLYIITRRYEKALAIADYLAKHENSRQAAVAIVTDVYIARGQHERAKKALVEFLEHKPTSTWARQELAEVHEYLGEFREAEALHKKLIRQDHAKAWSLHNYALYLRRRGRLDQAIDHSQRALAEHDHPTIREVLGNSFYLKGSQLLWELRDEGKAVTHFQKALEYDPDNLEIIYGLGAAYGELARRDKTGNSLKKAIAYIERYLAEKPDDNSVQEYYRQLLQKKQQSLVH